MIVSGGWKNGSGVRACKSAGKVTLKFFTRSFIVHHLQQSLNRAEIGIAYIYCNYKEVAKQKLDQLLAHLLHQLVAPGSLLTDQLMTLYQTNAYKQTRPSIEDYTGLLHAAVQSFDKVYVVVDALDECPETDGTRKSLIAELRALNINVLITSRDLPIIQNHLSNAVRLEIRASEEDIQEYIQYRIRESDRIATYVERSPELRDLITSKILQNAKGM